MPSCSGGGACTPGRNGASEHVHCDVAPKVGGSGGHETQSMGLGATIDGCMCEALDEGELLL